MKRENAECRLLIPRWRAQDSQRSTSPTAPQPQPVQFGGLGRWPRMDRRRRQPPACDVCGCSWAGDRTGPRCSRTRPSGPVTGELGSGPRAAGREQARMVASPPQGARQSPNSSRATWPTALKGGGLRGIPSISDRKSPPEQTDLLRRRLWSVSARKPLKERLLCPRQGNPGPVRPPTLGTERPRS